jgi:CHAT domain-containing protein/Tfp pilus assembly protein PilF
MIVKRYTKSLKKLFRERSVEAMKRSFTTWRACLPQSWQSCGRRVGALWIIGLCCVFAMAAGQLPDAQKLASGAPVERALSGGQVHDYRIALEAGQGLKIKVDQRGIDVVVVLSDPDGKELTKEDGWEENNGTEQIVWAAQAGGDYRLQVRSAGKEAAPGRYEVRIDIFPEDEKFTNAVLALNEGGRLLGDKKPEQSLGSFEESFKLWQTLGDREMEARALFYASSIAYDLRILPKALDYSLQALAIYRSLGMKKEEYFTLSVISSSYGSIGDIQKMLFYDQQRIPLTPMESPRAAANLNINLGIGYMQLGDYQKSAERLNEALRLARGEHAHLEEMQALSALADLYFRMNEPTMSLDSVNAALPLSRDLKQPVDEGSLLLRLGEIYARVSEPQQAITFLKQALQLTDNPEGRTMRAQILSLLGMTLDDTGDAAAALEALDQALKLTRSAGAKLLEMRTLARIGGILSRRGEFQQALDYLQQAGAYFHTNGQRNEEAGSLIELALTYERTGQKQKARETLDQALALVRTLAGSRDEAATLRLQSLFARDDGDLKKARELIEAALRIREESRNKFAGPSLRASYGASSQNFYETYLDILAQMHELSPREGYDAIALAASERARARGLLDLLAESQADIQQGADPALLEKERSLQRQLSAKDKAYRDLIDSSRTAAAAKTVAKEISDLTVQLQLVEAQLRASSPRYTALTQPQPLNTAEIQGLIDNNTVLLEFAFGSKQGWMWAVTPGAMASFRLPSRQEIEAAAQKLYITLTARQPKPHESSIQFEARVAGADARFQTEAFLLSRMLLGPIAPRLGGEWKGKRLVIVASGALDYLPFALLPVPSIPEANGPEANGKVADGYHPLIADHEIMNLPSASVLALIRRESAGRRKAARELAILADPVFEANDPRVLMAARKRKPAQKPASSLRKEGAVSIVPPSDPRLMRSARSFNREGFSQLPYSRKEAEAIALLIPKAKLLKATDFDANRATATSGELSRYRIIHFATHGLLNSEYPDLSGLVLSLVDRNGAAQDGFLRMQEIYNLKLPADVIVLSACQTAIGKEIRGEGLIGLTRGFMYAGAERVVASLWQVDDLATAELMKRFYRGMLKDGMRPAAALRAAQLEMMKQKPWASPFFWAAFTMQGEWR